MRVACAAVIRSEGPVRGPTTSPPGFEYDKNCHSFRFFGTPSPASIGTPEETPFYLLSLGGTDTGLTPQRVIKGLNGSIRILTGGLLDDKIS